MTPSAQPPSGPSPSGPSPSGQTPGTRRFRRPTLLDATRPDGFGSSELDPAQIAEVAHETAAILVRTGRAVSDPELTDRLVRLVDELGLDTVADLWAALPARTLPGALWRLYVLREWARRDAVGAGADYAAGVAHADVSSVIAGAATPPGPGAMRDLADAILRGVYEGDVAGAFDRAAAFCRVVAVGRAGREPDEVHTDARGRSPSSQETSSAHARSAASVLQMGEDLAACARLWRRGDLL